MIEIKKRGARYAFPWQITLCGEVIGIGSTELEAYRSAINNLSNRLFEINELSKEIALQARGGNEK